MLPSGSPASTIFRQGRRALFATTAALGVALLGGAAHANIMFDPNNDPQSNEQTIQFEQFDTLPSFFGDTNQTNTPIEFNLIPGYTVNGTTETGIGTDGKGQADVVCSTGCGTFGTGGANGHQLEDLEIKMGAGFGATDFIGNLDFGEGTFNVIVTDQMGAIFPYVLGNGQNFFTLTATNGEVITDIQIEGVTPNRSGNLGFNDFKQPRVSGVCTLVGTTCTIIPVPEPSSLALLGAGLFAAGWFSTRKKSRNLAMTA